MIEVNKDIKLLEAVRYITQNSTLSFHHVSIKFGVDVQELQNEYKRTRVNKDTK